MNVFYIIYKALRKLFMPKYKNKDIDFESDCECNDCCLIRTKYHEDIETETEVERECISLDSQSESDDEEE